MTQPIDQIAPLLSEAEALRAYDEREDRSQRGAFLAVAAAQRAKDMWWVYDWLKREYGAYDISSDLHTALAAANIQRPAQKEEKHG